MTGSQRGWHVVCIDKTDLSVKATDTFDLFNEPDRNDAFLSFLFDECQAGDILVAFVVNDGATNLAADVKEALFVLYGATDISKLAFRDSYILVSRKAEDGAKCALNSDGFYEQRTCDVHPPNDLFDNPAAVTRYTDQQCEQAYLQSVWPTDTCTGGRDSSSVVSCDADGMTHCAMVFWLTIII